MNKSKGSGTAKIISDGEAVTIVGSESVIRIGLKPEPYVAAFCLNSPPEVKGENQVVSVTKDNITQEEAPFDYSKIGAGRVVFTLSGDASQGGKSDDN